MSEVFAKNNLFLLPSLILLVIDLVLHFSFCLFVFIVGMYLKLLFYNHFGQ